MNQTTMKIFKFYLAWEDEKEEDWLRVMAQTGWRLTQVVFPGIYSFERSEPADMVYRLDFNPDLKNYSTYLRLFEDAGWEHVLSYGSWQYFRIRAKPGENPEIFSDNASKVIKYRRLLLVLVVLLPLFLFNLRNLQSGALAAMQVVAGISFVVLLFYIYAIAMLIRRITQLQRMRE